MIPEKDIHMEEAAKEMYVLSADEMIEQRCRARNDYQKQINTHNRTLQELEEATKALQARDAEIKSKDHEIEFLKQQLAEALDKKQ